MKLILATKSKIRCDLLRQANVSFEAIPARIDEEAVKASLQREDAKPRDIADTLAEMKALKLSEKFPEAVVIGCDQVLSLDRKLMSKPRSKDDAVAQLQMLRGQVHHLHSAAVIYIGGKPEWRHVGGVRMFARNLTNDYIADYVDRNWSEIQHCVGGYQLESEGVRLFERIEGDYFCVLGLPLMPILSFLTLRGILAG